MVWSVEVEAPLISRRHLWFTLLMVELRHFWWMQLAVLGAGLGVWALLGAVTAHVSTDARPEGVVFNYMSSLVLSAFPVLLMGSGLISGGSRNRNGFWLSLPLTRNAVNYLRISSLTIILWPVLLTWPLIIILLGKVYGPVSPWALVNSALLVVLALLLSLRTRLATVIVYFVLPVQVVFIYLVPGARGIATAWTDLNISFWTSMALTILAVGIGRHALRAHPPRS